MTQSIVHTSHRFQQECIQSESLRNDSQFEHFDDLKSSILCIMDQKRKNKEKIRFKQSTWTQKENRLYKNFIKRNLDLFESDIEKRRSIKINVLMSKAVRTRSADQCRSHHQKMMKLYASIENIIRCIEGGQYRKTQKAQMNTTITHAQEQKSLEIVKKAEDENMDLCWLNYDQMQPQFPLSNVWWDGISI